MWTNSPCKVLHDLDGKEFKSVSAGDLDLDTAEEKEEEQKQQEENKDLLRLHERGPGRQGGRRCACPGG